MALNAELEKQLQTSIIKALKDNNYKTMARHVKAEFNKGSTYLDVLDGLRGCVDVLRETAWEVSQAWDTEQALKKLKE